MKTEQFYEDFFNDNKRTVHWMKFADSRMGMTIIFLDGEMFEAPLLLEDGIFEQWIAWKFWKFPV